MSDSSDMSDLSDTTYVPFCHTSPNGMVFEHHKAESKKRKEIIMTFDKFTIKAQEAVQEAVSS
ncbi:MAG: hypothetical protein J6Y97_00490, partial [Prevotella sp.]|nr:hypothetical protein [Prevotella sp.]